ncbi:glycosyltransferase family 4 protein [Nitrogeniibacter aestuarii]|uniref:glycosyltransferase family 4 protein n=1 Tax=Nitrogeniibacter aestuarii TaxID=2815343 RepID=UPI001E3CDB07|nr:glycosyltransferase family 1 protein [Nitrogeniibacter aestuarii]
MNQSPLTLEHLAGVRRQLRVAVVTETYPPEVNGVAMTTGRLVSQLIEMGHIVTLVRPRQGAADIPAQDERFEEVLSRGIPIPKYNHLKMGLPARHLLTKLWSVRRPDVVQIVTEGPLGWSALGAARKLRIPAITEFHTNFHSYSRYYGVGWLKQPVEAYLRRFHNKGEMCLVPTRAMADKLSRKGVRAVEVVARGVDTALFSPARRSEALREQWGARPETLVATVVGRVAPEKNLALALRAFDALAERHGDARLVVVGDGPSLDALKASHPRHIYVGMRTGEDLASHYASADLFLFPSTTETFGNVATEALASGLPVVGYDYAAVAERVKTGLNGWRVPMDDEAAFVHAAMAAANPGALEPLRHGARESVLELDWRAIAQTLVDVMESVLARHEARAGLAAAR